MFFEFIFSFAQRFINDPGISIIVLSLVMNFLVLPLYKRVDAMQAEEQGHGKQGFMTELLILRKFSPAMSA